MRDFLTRLLDVPGPSGHEAAAAAEWRSEAERFSDRVWCDVHGSAFAEIGAGGSPTVMLAGHIDEIGLMIHHIDDSGYLYLQPVGGWDPQVLVGQRVDILGDRGPVTGVIGRAAPHLMEKEEREKAVKIKDLWIDIGARGDAEARSRVGIGDVAVIRSDTVRLGEGRLAARSVDDRVGAAVALEALRRAKQKGAMAHVVAVATTQEEIGARSGGGARTSSYEVDPAAAIVIDVTHATDHPQIDQKEHGDVKLGGGPVLSRGAVINPALYRKLVEAAESAGIPFQVLASPSASSTDADNIFTSRAGVATAIVSVPNRYMHSPNQMVDFADVERAAELVGECLARLPARATFLPEA